MKKILFVFSMAAMLMGMTACGNKSNADASAENSDESPAMKLLNSVEFSEEGLVSMIKTPADQPLSDDEYEALWLAYSKVPINQGKLELETNPISKARSTIMKDHKRPANASAIQEKLLTNPSPQVRGMAMGQFSSLFGLSKENVAKLTSILAEEKDPFVIKEGVKALSNELKKEEAAKFVLGQVKSDNKNIRKVVAYAVGNSWSIGVPGVTDAAKTLIADKDEDVRGAMLNNVGDLEDESFIPELVKVLNDDKQYKLHDKCMNSLYKLWYDFPFHKHTSKAAYDATIAYLSKKPRTENVPAWNSIGELRTQAESSFDAWKAKATYFKVDEYIKLMTDIATDANANWLGRSAAIDVIEKLGTKADLEKVQSAIKANTADDKQKLVLSAIEKKLK
jgi:HEAT repeat protein